jgi:Tfp pilus assembly protein PilN
MEINLLRPHRRRSAGIRNLSATLLLVCVSAAAGFGTMVLWRGTAELQSAQRDAIRSEVSLLAQRKRDATADPDRQLAKTYGELRDASPDPGAILRTISQALPPAGTLTTIAYGSTNAGELTLEGSLPTLQAVAAYMQVLGESGLFQSVSNPAATGQVVPAAGQSVQFSLRLLPAKKGEASRP